MSWRTSVYCGLPWDMANSPALSKKATARPSLTNFVFMPSFFIVSLSPAVSAILNE